MKAALAEKEKYDSIDDIHLQDVAIPDILPGQACIRISAASIGFSNYLRLRGLCNAKDLVPHRPGQGLPA
jgi:hypothetical protein